MRWINVIRVRRVLATGGSTYESASRIAAIKGLDFTLYLRARRSSVEINRSNFISHAAKNKVWLRTQHLKRKG